MNSKAKIGLGVGAFVVALGAAVGVGAVAANLAGSDTNAQAASGGYGQGGSGQGGQGRSGQGGGGFDSTELAKSLATKLGVDQDTVATALKEVMTANRPSGQPSGDPSGMPSGAPSGDPGNGQAGGPGGSQQLETMAKALAEKLNLEESKVLAALQEVMPSGRGGGQPSGEPSK